MLKNVLWPLLHIFERRFASFTVHLNMSLTTNPQDNVAKPTKLSSHSTARFSAHAIMFDDRSIAVTWAPCFYSRTVHHNKTFHSKIRISNLRWLLVTCGRCHRMKCTHVSKNDYVQNEQNTTEQRKTVAQIRAEGRSLPQSKSVGHTHHTGTKVEVDQR